MRLVARIDAQGNFIEDVLIEDGQPTPQGCIESRPPEGFHAPKWNAAKLAWVEGKPASEVVEARKPQKVEEMHAVALEELSSLFTEGRGRDELLFLLAAHVKRICEAIGVQVDPRLSEVERVGQKALAKRDEVEAASTPEELEAISW